MNGSTFNFLLGALAAGVIALVSGCVKGEAPKSAIPTYNEVIQQKEPAKANQPILYIDTGTGCHYLTAGGHSALTPRMDSSGLQVCRKSDIHK